MARIPMTGGFTMMAEGEHILKITEAEYKEEFGKLRLTMQNKQGKRHFEQYQLFDKDGNPNDGACNAFSALARAAMRNNDMDDIDPDELVGKYLKGTISYREYEGRDGTIKKATQKAPGTWWEAVEDEEIAEFEGASADEAPKPKVNLAALLGR